MHNDLRWGDCTVLPQQPACNSTYTYCTCTMSCCCCRGCVLRHYADAGLEPAAAAAAGLQKQRCRWTGRRDGLCRELTVSPAKVCDVIQQRRCVNHPYDSDHPCCLCSCGIQAVSNLAQLSHVRHAHLQVYRHTVLAVCDTATGLYAALGISRCSHLMDKPLTYSSLSELVDEYHRAYT